MSDTHTKDGEHVKRLLMGLAAGALCLGSLTACGLGDKYSEPFKDAPRNGNDGTPAITIEMPDGFSNAAWKCLSGTHVLFISAYHGDNNRAAVSAVLDPADCP